MLSAQKSPPQPASHTKRREEAESAGVATEPRLKFQKWKVLNFEEGKRNRGSSLKMVRIQCWKLGLLVNDANLAPGSSFSLGRQAFRARKDSNSRDRHDNRNARVRQIFCLTPRHIRVAPEKSDFNPEQWKTPKASDPLRDSLDGFQDLRTPDAIGTRQFLLASIFTATA